MTTPRRWFDRTFELGLGADAVPELVEQLRQTPKRLAQAVRGLSPETLTNRVDGKWSIQENAGHLFDLESLWDKRLDDYDAGATTLHPADLENRKTHEASHNKRPISEILADFNTARRAIIDRLAKMSPAELARTALHPRLQQPMSVVDLCYFVAEHDDHHLRTINELRAVAAKSRTRFASCALTSLLQQLQAGTTKEIRRLPSDPDPVSRRSARFRRRKWSP